MAPALLQLLISFVRLTNYSFIHSAIVSNNNIVNYFINYSNLCVIVLDNSVRYAKIFISSGWIGVKGEFSAS